MNKFSVYRVHRDNGRVAGRVEEAVLDDLPPGEVTIQAEYSSVNYKDALAATGDKIIRRFPLIGGIDVAGRVASSTDARFAAGDAVLVTGYDLGVAHDGGYAGFVRVPGEWVVPLPAGMTSRQAMALGTAGLTAALCLHRLECNGQAPDQGPILVTGATGGVGMLVIDILARRGFEVTALTGKPGQGDLLQALGASAVLDRRALKLEGPPLDKGQWGGAIDNVGGDVLGWLTRTVRPWGNIVAVGLAGGTELHTTVMPFILRGVGLLGVTSAGCPAALRRELWQRLAGDLAPRHLEQIVTREAALEQLPAVFADMLAGKTVGRTLVRISNKPE